MAAKAPCRDPLPLSIKNIIGYEQGGVLACRTSHIHVNSDVILSDIHRPWPLLSLGNGSSRVRPVYGRSWCLSTLGWMPIDSEGNAKMLHCLVYIVLEDSDQERLGRDRSRRSESREYLNWPCMHKCHVSIDRDPAPAMLL